MSLSCSMLETSRGRSSSDAALLHQLLERVGAVLPASLPCAIFVLCFKSSGSSALGAGSLGSLKIQDFLAVCRGRGSC